MQAHSILWSLLLVVLAVMGGGGPGRHTRYSRPPSHRLRYWRHFGLEVLCLGADHPLNGGALIPLLYGAPRPAVLAADACAHDRVGFLTIMNWGELGDGDHAAVAYDDGVAFARSRLRVVTTGEAFLANRNGVCRSSQQGL